MSTAAGEQRKEEAPSRSGDRTCPDRHLRLFPDTGLDQFSGTVAGADEDPVAAGPVGHHDLVQAVKTGQFQFDLGCCKLAPVDCLGSGLCSVTFLGDIF